jgi:hypothetical protein
MIENYWTRSRLSVTNRPVVDCQGPVDLLKEDFQLNRMMQTLICDNDLVMAVTHNNQIGIGRNQACS